MKKILSQYFWLATFCLCFSSPINACTGFGAITDTGTLIGKNRDYYYVPQKFGLVMPIQQFSNWLGNTYHHNNKFYAVTSAESVSMGVNQNGLTAIEEDSLSLGHPQNASDYKKLQQQLGTPDGLVLYGVLQNFNTVDEMIPYLSKIFTTAASDYYQFADANKILTVEVAHHNFTYQIISEKNNYFAHTNTYLSPEFSSLNTLFTNQDSLNSSNNRLQRITYLISHSPTRNIAIAAAWLRDTHSDATDQNKPAECLNTSLFRTNLQNLQSININTPNDKVFGTVATMIVNNQGDFKKSFIYVMMLQSITTEPNGKQLIKYNELNTTLAELFNENTPKFVEQEFERNLPINGVCS